MLDAAAPLPGAVLITLLLSAAVLMLSAKRRRWEPGADRQLQRTAPAGSSDMPDGVGLHAPIMLELAAAMLEAGSSLDQALAVLSQVSGEQTGRGLATVVSAIRLGASWDQAWAATRGGGSAATLAEVEEGLGFAAATGAPSSALLSSQAQQLRRRSYRQAEQRAAALGVKLVLPMGLCSLPAFVCIGVLPVLLAMLPSMG